MSVVTNLLLAVSAGDDCWERTGDELVFPPGLAAVRAWCLGEAGDAVHREDADLIGWPAASVNQASAGTRNMECGVYAWGANYLDLETFLKVVRTAPWRDPDQVQVMVRGQNDDRFQVYNLTAARIWMTSDVLIPRGPAPTPDGLDVPALVDRLAALEPGERKTRLAFLTELAPGMADTVVPALNQRLLASKHTGEPTSLRPGTVVRVTDRLLSQIGATAPLLWFYLQTPTVDRLACLHDVSPYRFALTFPRAPVATDRALSAELDRLVNCDDPVKLFELHGEPLDRFVVAAPDRTTAEPAAAHALPFGAVPVVQWDAQGKAAPLHCVVMGGVYLPDLATSAQIAGLVRPLPALLRHRTLVSEAPLPRLVEQPDAPGRFAQADGDPVTDAYAQVDFEIIAGASPEAVAAEVANRILQAIRVGRDRREPMTRDALCDALKAYVVSHDGADPTTMALTAAQWAAILAWPEAGADWKTRPPETLFGIRLVAVDAPRFALGGDAPPASTGAVGHTAGLDRADFP